MRSVINLCALICAITITSCKENNFAYKYSDYGLNTPVKSIKVTTYEAKSKFGEIEKGMLEYYGHYSTIFNDDGLVVSITQYNDEGDTIEITKHKYNDDNNVINTTCYNEDGEINYETKWTYDGDQVKSVTTTNYWDGTSTTYEDQYINDGDTVVERRKFKDGTLLSVDKFSTFDEKGAKWVSYDADGNKLSNGSFTLTKTGAISKYTYDDIQYQVKRDKNNLPIQTKNAIVGLNGVTHYYKEGANLFFEYEYDDKGNWIKQIVFEDDMREPLTISERKIVY